jgi:hypothetical protein
LADCVAATEGKRIYGTFLSLAFPFSNSVEKTALKYWQRIRTGKKFDFFLHTFLNSTLKY